jgi:hypothetical protein
MSFNEAAACLSIGIGILVLIWLVSTGKFGTEDGSDLEPFVICGVFVAALVAVCAWCFIAGLYWIAKDL